LAGVPQVVVPHLYDQPHFASRVQELEIGQPAADSMTEVLTHTLNQALQPEVAERAQAFAADIRTDGAAVAASYLS
jgi:vancomycin aglycone glucosyltransferase